MYLCFHLLSHFAKDNFSFHIGCYLQYYICMLTIVTMLSLFVSCTSSLGHFTCFLIIPYFKYLLISSCLDFSCVLFQTVSHLFLAGYKTYTRYAPTLICCQRYVSFQSCPSPKLEIK